jgi:hypothetical protein
MEKGSTTGHIIRRGNVGVEMLLTIIISKRCLGMDNGLREANADNIGVIIHLPNN